MSQVRIKKGDTVVVTTGKDRGKKAKVVRAMPDVDKVIVEGVNTSKRHQKPRYRGDSGQVLEIDMPIHVSNVMVYDEAEKKRTRTGVSAGSGKRVRVSKKTGNEI